MEEAYPPRGSRRSTVISLQMVKKTKLPLEWTPWSTFVRYASIYDVKPSDVREGHILLVLQGKHPQLWRVLGDCSPAEFGKMEVGQKSEPISLATVGESRLWWYGDAIYEADLDLESADVLALLLEAENKRRLKLEKAHALMAMRKQLDSKARRQPIPQDVKVLVWQRDGGRCVECGSQEHLEYDHVIPLAMGGSNTDRNLQLLCEVCNRRKGATLG